MTAVQLRNTVRDLASLALKGSATAATVMTEIAGALDAVPVEGRAIGKEEERGSFRRLDQNVDQSHVESLYGLGVALGRALGRTERLSALLGPCATDATACVEAFIGRIGARALRRPLAAEEFTFLKGVYGDVRRPDAADVADLAEPPAHGAAPPRPARNTTPGWSMPRLLRPAISIRRCRSIFR